MDRKEKTMNFENDMREYYDINLSTKLEGSEKKISAFFNRVEMIVMQEIKTNNPSFQEEHLKEKQREELWKAILEQAYYMLNNYDMFIVSGFDPINNSTISIEEIRKRAFSSLARTILTNAGLRYRGIGSIGFGYQHERRGWR